ncbi:DoxX family protein [Kineococcus glutinatus]|uniref:Methylamine utilisation protein MauE domain-containing protein n=1 Tax=Kineococcus glutinatus TaxID=1070872 RepID=A0ABP9H9V4_9ACTN
MNTPDLRPALRAAGQTALGLVLLTAGTGHLTTQRQEFQAQVPPWLPLDADLVVVASGVVELALGAALVAAWKQPARALAGATAAAFFVAVFPGNVSQLITRTDAFGLDSDTKRAVRLVFQPGLVAWALWATRARHTWRSRSGRRRAGGGPG